MHAAAPERPLLGCETPRLWTPPLRELTPVTPDVPGTTVGYEAVEFAEDVLGLRLIPWQRWLLVHMLELAEPWDGTGQRPPFRFRTVVILVGRQNGKTTLSQVLSLWRMYVDGAGLVIGTAQNLDVAEESWSATVDLAESVPDLAGLIAAVDRTNGKKALRLATGERYKVAAASRRGGRGLAGSELVLLDELREHQRWDSWAAVTKTTNARPGAQIVCTSNAGDATSVVLAHLRGKALRALEDGTHPESSLGLFEWSALEGCDVRDRAAWAQANPSLGWTITEKVIADGVDVDPEPITRTEVLCQWVEQLRPTVFPLVAWSDCADADSRIANDSPVAFAVDTSWDRQSSWIAVAGRRGDGLVHVELAATGPGTDWVVGWLTPRLTGRPVAGVGLQGNGAPVSSLLRALQEAAPGVVVPLSGPDVAKACGAAYDLVRTQSLRHRGEESLDDAVVGGVSRPMGDAWVLDRRRSEVDVSALLAAVEAVHVLVTSEPPDYDISSSIY